MDRTIKELREYTQDLRSVLELECSREDARAYGTLREWKSIDRRIRRIERKTRRFQSSLAKESRNQKDVRENIKYALVLSLPFLVILLKAVVDIGIVALVVYLALNWMDKPFSVPIVVVMWIVIEVVAFLLRGKTKH